MTQGPAARRALAIHTGSPVVTETRDEAGRVT